MAAGDSKTVETESVASEPATPIEAPAELAPAEIAALEEKLKAAKSKLAKAKRLKGLIEKAILAIDGYRLAAEQEYGKAYTKLKKATGEDASWLAELEFLSGEQEEGLKDLRSQVKRRPAEVIPRARLAYALFLRAETLTSDRDEGPREVDTCIAESTAVNGGESTGEPDTEAIVQQAWAEAEEAFEDFESGIIID